VGKWIGATIRVDGWMIAVILFGKGEEPMDGSRRRGGSDA